jgi:hypothetical protein
VQLPIDVLRMAARPSFLSRQWRGWQVFVRWLVPWPHRRGDRRRDRTAGGGSSETTAEPSTRVAMAPSVCFVLLDRGRRWRRQTTRHHNDGSIGSIIYPHDFLIARSQLASLEYQRVATTLAKRTNQETPHLARKHTLQPPNQTG